MKCSQCRGIEKEFDTKYVSREIKKYHKKGPARNTLKLISVLQQEGVKGKSLLDIGGGVGAIQHELFRYGLQSAAAADASSAYLKAAKQEAQTNGTLEKTNFHHGDFLDLADHIEPADIVTLDRVICCYNNMNDLVRLSAAKAKKLYAAVYPRDVWWVKSIFSMGNFFLRLFNNPFRIFAHSTKEVDALITTTGFTRYFYEKSGKWQIVVYKRVI